MLSSPNACLIVASVSVARFPRFTLKFDAHSLPDASQIKGPKNQHVAQLREILYTDSQDMLILSSTVASHYNCCTDGSISLGKLDTPSYANQ
jgi:hypothetical protein